MLANEAYHHFRRLAKEEKDSDIFVQAERTATIISTVAVANLLLGVIKVFK